MRYLDGNDHNEEQKATTEMDPFSRFMFGDRKRRQEQIDSRSNHNDDWIFGRKRKGNENKQNQTLTTQNKIENIINNVDIGLLLETYDTIVTTTKQYKPLLKGIAPFFSKFTNKFKK